MPIMPEIPIIPPKGIEGSEFSDGSDRLEEELEDSKGNGKERKYVLR